ncbi:MAG: hypothetical protein AAGI68_14220 [Planctomycetota bacterium]
MAEADLERVFVDGDAADFPASGSVWFRYGSRVLPDDSFEPRCMRLDAAGRRVALPRGARALLNLPSETFASCTACAEVPEQEPGAGGGGDPNGVITIYPPRVPGPGQYRQASLCPGQQDTANAPDVWVETRAVPADGDDVYSFEFGNYCYSIDAGELTDQADLPAGAEVAAPASANRIDGCGTCRNGYAMTLCPGEVPWTGPTPYVRAEVADTLLGGAVTSLYMRWRQRCWSISSADAIAKVPPDAVIVFPVDAFLSCGDCVCGDGPTGLPVGHLLTWCGSSSGGEVGSTPDLPQPVVVPLDELDGYDLSEFHTFTLRGSEGCWLHDPNRPRVRASLGGTIAQPVSRYPTCAPCLDAQDGPADTPDDPDGPGGTGPGGSLPPGSTPGCVDQTQDGCWLYQLWDCCSREWLNKWVVYPSLHSIAGGEVDGQCVAVGFRRRKTLPAGGEVLSLNNPVEDGVGTPCVRVELVGGCECTPAEPCTACNTNAPSAANIAGLTQASTSGLCSDDDCASRNGAIAFDAFTETADYCQWSWSVGNSPDSRTFFVRLAKRSHAFGPYGGFLTLEEGEWGVGLYLPDETSRSAGVIWEEKTTGFACDGTTGKISGTHSFGNATANEFGCCGGSPTVTVDP